MHKHTIIHVTHEAVHKIGGIGTVLQGLLTSKNYNDAVGRSILLGPLFDIGAMPTSAQRLGPDGHVVYSSMDGIYEGPYSEAFRRIEDEYGVRIVYGRRTFDPSSQTFISKLSSELEGKSDGAIADPEVLLFDTSLANQQKENELKRRLYERFGLESDRYESNGDYEQYLRIAEPGYDALKVMLADAQKGGKRLVISHEFMGMPLVLKVILEDDDSFSTIFHAHEAATIRRIVEESFGHDTMFYNVLERAAQEGKCVEDVFGTQDDYFKHALVERSRFCDNVFAVGDYTRKEMLFLWPNRNAGRESANRSVGCEPANRSVGCQPANRSVGCQPANRSVGREPANRSVGCQPAKSGGEPSACGEESSGHRQTRVDLVYNGVPAFEISLDEKLESKKKLQDYAEALLGYRPDYIFTHVTRLVISKGLWRDFRVLEHLDGMFQSAQRPACSAPVCVRTRRGRHVSASVRSVGCQPAYRSGHVNASVAMGSLPVAQPENGATGAFFILSSQAGTRSPADVPRMEQEYGWPTDHRLGYPDLVHDEAPFNVAVQKYNEKAKAIKAVFVNQFGWSQELCGRRMSSEMEFMDVRKGTDVEFGQSIYEPFGISQFEPLSFGAICVVSNVCGCCGFSEKIIGDNDAPNIIVADYTDLAELGSQIPSNIERLLELGPKERDFLEGKVSRGVAAKIMERLPGSEEAMSSMIAEGYRIASQMSWEVVVADYFLPGLERAVKQ